MNLTRRQLQYLNMKRRVGLLENRILNTLENSINHSMSSETHEVRSISSPNRNITISKNSVSDGIDEFSDIDVIDKDKLKRIYKSEINGIPYFSDYRRLRKQEYLDQLGRI